MVAGYKSGFAEAKIGVVSVVRGCERGQPPTGGIGCWAGIVAILSVGCIQGEFAMKADLTLERAAGRIYVQNGMLR